MKDERTDDATALEALRFVRDYAARINGEQGSDVRTLIRTARGSRDLLEKSSLPPLVNEETRRALDEILDLALDWRLRFDETLAQEKERVRDEYAKKRREENATTGKILITLVCVALGFVLAFKGAAPWCCALVYVVLYVWGEKEPLLRAVDAIGKFCSNK